MDKQAETNGISTGTVVTLIAVLVAIVLVGWAFFRDSGPLNIF